MAAKGQIAKSLVSEAILKIFPGAFLDADGKTIRIPSNAEGDLVEIKVALTAAKDVVGGSAFSSTEEKVITPQDTKMTDAEVEEVRALIAELGL